MAYHRVEPYVWDDGETVHVWSHRSDGETGWKHSIPIDGKIFDEVCIKRLGHLILEGRVPEQLHRFIRKMGGNWQNEMFKALKCKRKRAA